MTCHAARTDREQPGPSRTKPLSRGERVLAASVWEKAAEYLVRDTCAHPPCTHRACRLLKDKAAYMRANAAALRRAS